MPGTSVVLETHDETLLLYKIYHEFRKQSDATSIESNNSVLCILKYPIRYYKIHFKLIVLLYCSM